MKKHTFLIIVLAIASVIIVCGRKSLNVSTEETEKNQSTQQTDYPSVEIGNNVWMTENLNVSQFSNGDEIFQATTMDDWIDAGKQKKAAWCYYEFNAENESAHGKLYNLHAVTDTRGLAPEGWKIPATDDFSTLIDFARKISPDDLKSCLLENGKSGFNAKYSGWVDEEGYFDGMNSGTSFWSSTVANGWGKMLYIGSYDSGVLIDENTPENGYSVRCIKK
jgi:uncharacterized protein (TIGR02145 family)